jgi:pimeloyl-ACP methyl ester carboxylesterase
LPTPAERLARDIPNAELTWVDDAIRFAPCGRPNVVARLLARPAAPAATGSEHAP